MKTRVLFLMILLSCTFGFAANRGNILLTGASFAVSENGWFEIGCEVLNFNPVNRAVSAQAIMQTAQAMSNGALYTTEQLDDIEALVIMHVHNKNVASEDWLKEDYNDYELTNATPYNIAYDYVIRKYKDDCKNLKDVPTSKYYGTSEGKPAIIVLCTHWHDSRTVYNSAIRKLAEKWNLPLIEWDTQIGFTKDVLESDGSQPSLKFAGDTETIDRVEYGWHPLRGKGQYIQNKMAEIFIAKIATIFNIEIPLKATMMPKEMVIFEGEKAHVRCVFSGLSPYNLNYKVNDATYTKEGIADSPLLLEIPYTSRETIHVEPTGINNVQVNNGEIEGGEDICFAKDSVVAFFDTHVHEAYKDQSFVAEKIIQLKNGDAWSRQAYFSFKLSKIKLTDKRIVFRSYFADINLSDNETLQLEGNAETYTDKLNWNTKDKKEFSVIGENEMYFSEVGSYVCWDVTDFVRQQKEKGADVITLRMSIVKGGTALCSFYSTEADELKYRPSLLIADDNSTVGIQETDKELLNVVPSIFNDFITVMNEEGSRISISNICGQCYHLENSVPSNEYVINTTSYPEGVYLFQCKQMSGRKLTNKLIKSK